jgi:hypothetical protein
MEDAFITATGYAYIPIYVWDDTLREQAKIGELYFATDENGALRNVEWRDYVGNRNQLFREGGWALLRLLGGVAAATPLYTFTFEVQSATYTKMTITLNATGEEVWAVAGPIYGTPDTVGTFGPTGSRNPDPWFNIYTKLRVGGTNVSWIATGHDIDTQGDGPPAWDFRRYIEATEPKNGAIRGETLAHLQYASETHFDWIVTAADVGLPINSSGFKFKFDSDTLLFSSGMTFQWDYNGATEGQLHHITLTSVGNLSAFLCTDVDGVYTEIQIVVNNAVNSNVAPNLQWELPQGVTVTGVTGTQPPAGITGFHYNVPYNVPLILAQLGLVSNLPTVDGLDKTDFGTYIAGMIQKLHDAGIAGF